MRYVLTDVAKADIAEITRHIRDVQRSPQNAKLVAARLRTLFRKLVRLPQLGHKRDELQDDHARIVAETGVLVIYDPTIKPLTILRVIHSARDIGRLNPRG